MGNKTGFCSFFFENKNLFTNDAAFVVGPIGLVLPYPVDMMKTNVAPKLKFALAALFSFLILLSPSPLVLAQGLGQKPPKASVPALPSENRLRAHIPSHLFDLASPEERAIFAKAEDFFDQGSYALARSYLKDFLDNYPENVLLPDTFLLLSETYSELGELKQAVATIKTFLDRFPLEPRVEIVQLRLSDLYFKLGNLEAIVSLWEAKPGLPDSKKLVFEKLANAYVDRQAFLNALDILIKRKALSSDPIDEVLIQHEIELLIREKLKEDGLQKVANQFQSTYPADLAIIQLIHLYDLNSNYYRQEKEIRRFLSRFPAHPYVIQARNQLDRIKEKIKSDRYLIAVVLPLSGRLVHFGNKALYGAELALRLFKEALPMASVGLVVRDTENDPSSLRMPFEDWLNEYAPVAVVGPLLSKEVERISPIIEKANLALITPGATAANLSGLGQSVFRNAATNRFLCSAIAEYAVLQLSIERFAVLYPDEGQGQRWVDCFAEGVKDLGGEVVLSESYPLNNTDFSKTILRLKKADLEKNGFIETIELEGGKEEKLYIPGFEAIFLPADAVRAGLIIPQLIFHDFHEVKVLGTNSWNTPEFLNLAGSYAEGVVFAEGFFKGSTNPIVQGFVHQYRTRFQEEPDLFAAQAFDATRLVLAALRGGAVTPEQVKTAIAGAIDFPGVSGFIYEILDGEVIKEPFFIEVQGGEFVQVN